MPLREKFSKPSTRLRRIAEKKTAEEAKKYLDTFPEEKRPSLLHDALEEAQFRRDQWKGLKNLLSIGADIHQDNENILRDAVCFHRDVDKITLAYENGADFEKAILFATLRGKTKDVKSLEICRSYFDKIEHKSSAKPASPRPQ